MKSISTNITICDTIASVKSTLVYKNEENAAIEAEFVFPMDDDSAVYKFDVEIDGKHIVGECQEKEQAKESYQEAISQGHTAFLLHEDETAGDIFHMSVGCLPAGKTAIIKFAYVVQLNFDDEGAVRLVLPRTLNPRYTPSEEGVGVSSTSLLPTQQGAIPVQYDFQFNAQIVSRLQVKDISSQLAPIRWKREEENKISVTLPNSFNQKVDLDLRVVYENPHKSVMTLEPGAEGQTGILQNDVIMLNFYPDTDRSATTANAEFIFLVDRSGSMGGDNINQAKATLLLFLKSLPVACYFNIVSFGNDFSTLFPESQECNEQTLEQAIRLQKTMNADMGGTEMLGPLKHIFESMTRRDNYPRQLFVLTDGMVSNTQAVINLVKTHANHTRLFAFGIGTGVSTSLVKGIARAGKGKAEFVTGSDRLQPKIISCLKLATQPSTTSVSVEWCVPDGFTVTTIPEHLPALFAGEHLVAYSVVQKDDPSMPCTELSAILRAQIGDQFTEQRLVLSEEAVQSSDDLLLHRTAAKMQIKQLELADDQMPGNSTTPTKQKMVLLSLASNIVSNYTAFFGVDMTTKEKVYDQNGMPLWHLYSGPRHTYRCSLSMAKGSKPGRLNPVRRSASLRCSAPPGMPKIKTQGLCKGFPSPKEFMVNVQCEDICVTQTLAHSFAGAAMFKSNIEIKRKKDKPSYSCRMPQEGNISTRGALESIISLQKFDGSWELDEDLLKLIQIELKGKLCPVKSSSVWATILVITWLEKACTNKADEWEMIAAKAKTWLQTQAIELPHTVESLTEAAKKCF